MNSAECWAHFCEQTNKQVAMNVTLSSLEQFPIDHFRVSKNIDLQNETLKCKKVHGKMTFF